MGQVVATYSTRRQNGPTAVPLQGSNRSLQGGSTRPIQGSSPSLQGSSPRLQVTANPMTMQIAPAANTAQTPTPTPQLPPVPEVYDAEAAKAAAAAAAKRAIMDASVRGIQSNIDSLGVRKANTIEGVNQRYNGILARYGTQEAENLNTFNKEVGANEGTYSRNQSLALQGAATGRQSLLANLGAIGALGPTALKLAGRAVAKSANSDLGESRRTFETNATTLTDSYDKTKNEEKNRRLEAEAAAAAERQQAEYDYLESLQKAYSDMASTYAQGEDVGNATAWTDKAGGLYGQLAGFTKPVVTPYAARDIALDTSNLGTYIAGQRANTVSTKGGGGGPTALNSPLYSLARRKEELA